MAVDRQPNVVLVVCDTLRTAELRCYGDTRVQTPNIDAFARRSVRFTRAFPESLPTIPVRRALHTGRRCYPFHDYHPLKWDIVCLPGWQAMKNEEDTLAENLVETGYHTGFITDTLPCFTPGFNFHRGFWQWEYVRGQMQDRWRSPFTVSTDRLSCYGNPKCLQRNLHGLIPTYLANIAHVNGEEDTTTVRTFKLATQFLEDNRQADPFYLLVDSFAPHEPWEAPENYYRLYGDPNREGRRIMHCGYGPLEQAGHTRDELTYVKAHYDGLVTLVDTWFGKFMRKLDDLGLSENTWVFFISDHGTNFCENPRNIVGKPHDAMYPGVMRLPLLVRAPDESCAGEVRSEFVYNLDVAATIYGITGAQREREIDGQSLLPLLSGQGIWEPREYVTCRYDNSLCYVDDKTWALTDIDGCPQEVFDIESDPACRRSIDKASATDRFAVAWKRLLEDANGGFPDYRGSQRTDAIGQSVRKTSGWG